MKVRQLIWAGTAAYAAYHLVSRRQDIALWLKQSRQDLEETRQNRARVQNNLARVQQLLPLIERAGTDLAYKLQVFQKETQAHLEQIPYLQDREKGD